MNINKKTTIIFLAIAILVIAGVLYFAARNGAFDNPSQDAEGVILFYGDGCSHCADVEKYIQDNKINEKVQFTKLEVYNNQENAKKLLEKAVACGLNVNQVGIPFVWDGQKCIIGGPEVINFFKQQAGL